MLRVNNQGETKEEPRNDQRTPKLKKVLFLAYVTFWVPKSDLSDYK